MIQKDEQLHHLVLEKRNFVLNKLKNYYFFQKTGLFE